MKTLLCFIFLTAISATTFASDIYRWVDDEGKVHFSDSPSDTHSSETLELKINTFKSVTYESLSFEVPDSKRRNKVVMYSASWCGVCARAKRYFEANNIDYTEYDIETSQAGKAGFERLNGQGVPIILVGNQRMNGFSVAGFKKIYD